MTFDYRKGIENALAARNRARSEWAVRYWTGVADQLFRKLEKEYLDEIHGQEHTLH